MSKHHQIRWNDNDNKELARVVRNFNTKVKRLSKNPELKNALPKFWNDTTQSFTETVSIRQLKKLINTRQDLKRELNSLKRFSKKGSEKLVDVPDNDYNLKITKWQKREMGIRVGVINRRRKKRLEEILSTEVQANNEYLGYTVGQLGMGRASENSLKPMNAFTRRMERSDLDWKFRAIMNQSQSDYFTRKDIQVRENYIKGLEQNYNTEDVKDIIKAIKDMDLGEFLKKFQSVDLNTFEWASGPPSTEEYEGYVNRLKSTWNPER